MVVSQTHKNYIIQSVVTPAGKTFSVTFTVRGPLPERKLVHADLAKGSFSTANSAHATAQELARKFVDNIQV